MSDAAVPTLSPSPSSCRSVVLSGTALSGAALSGTALPSTQTSTPRPPRLALRLSAALALACLTLPAAARDAGSVQARAAQDQAAQDRAASDQAAPEQAASETASDQMPEAERIDLSFTLPVGQPVEVDNPYGSVYLRFGGYAHQLDVRATVQQPDGAPAFDFAPAASGGVFRVAPALPEGATPAATQRIDLVLYVPEGHALRVRTAAGTIESRGVRADVDFRSLSGDILARGTAGAVQAETASGAIRVMLEPAAPGVRQRLSTRTGDISVGVTDALGAALRLSSSGTLTTDYSLRIDRRDGEEPDKRAQAEVGVAKGAQPGLIEVESLRGNLRLWRRIEFVDASSPQGGEADD